MPLMITTCTGCRTRYRLDDDKVPHRVVRVRCPGCAAVFVLDGTIAEPDQSRAENGTPRPAARSEPAGPAAQSADSAAPAAAPEREQAVSQEAAVALEESPAQPTRRRSRDKARMLARAIVSDILVYNREVRDKALADGDLLEALGTEIKKSWELYKEKVGEQVANETTHFRDALNEILADGRRVF
jgi:predicted Zn finger-like uncharacterized protein